MFFKKNIKKTFKLAIKYCLVLFCFSNVCFVALYESFMSKSHEDKIAIMKKISEYYCKKQALSFDVKKISEDGDLLSVEFSKFSINIENIFSIYIDKIDITFSPIEILKFRTPIQIDNVKGLSLKIPIEDCEKENGEKFNYTESVKLVKKSIVKFVKIGSPIMKKGLIVDDARFIFIPKNGEKFEFFVDKFEIKPQKFLLTKLESSVSFISNIGKAVLSGKLVCNLGLTGRLKSCDVSIKASDMILAKNDIVKMNKVFENVPIIDGFAASFKLVLSGNDFIKNFTILSEKKKVLIGNKISLVEKMSLKASADNESLSIYDISLISEGISIISNSQNKIDLGKISGSIGAKIVGAKFADIEKFWPESKLSELKDFLSTSLPWTSGGRIDIDFSDGFDIKIKIDEAGIDNFGGFASGVVAKNLLIEINKEKAVTKIDKLFSKDGKIKISKPIINVFYKNGTKIDASFLSTDVLTFSFLESFYTTNPKMYSFFFGLFTDITGHSVISEENDARLLLSNGKISLDLSSEDIFGDMSFSAAGTFDAENIQFIDSKKGDIGKFIVNKKNRGEINASLFFRNPIPMKIFRNQKEITKAFAQIFVQNGGSVEIKAWASDERREILRTDIEISKGGFKLDGVGGYEKDEFDIKLDFQKNTGDFLLKSKINGLNLGWIIDKNFKFSKSNPNSPMIIKKWLFDLDISDIVMRNGVNLDQLVLDSSFQNNTISSLTGHLKTTGGDGKSDFLSIEKDKLVKDLYVIKSDQLDSLFDGILDKKNQMKISDISGSFLLLDGVSQIRIRTGESAIKLPNQDSFLMTLLKPIIPGFSTINNSLLYSKMSFDGKWFVFNDSSVLNVDEFYMKSLVSRVTGNGYIDIGNRKLDLRGKIDTAYKLNRILTAEGVPFLNKILTLGSKDGGYGAISYELAGKFSELNSKSLKLAGDKTNLIFAGGLIIINPLFAIPVIATTESPMKSENG